MAQPRGMAWFILVKCVAVAFCNYSAGIPVKVVGEEVSDAFCLVHFFDLVFGFVVAVVASIWDDNLTNLISRQQLFFKKMKIIFEARRAA